VRRVVITGLGCVTAAGSDVASTWADVMAGRHSFARHGDLEALGYARAVARPRDFSAAQLIGKRAPSLDPTAHYAIAASREAASQARLSDADPERVGCFIGSGGGPQVTADETARRLYLEGRNRVPPMTLPKAMLSGLASQVALEHGIKGPVQLVSSACASSAHAIGLAMQQIRHGYADVVLAGGAEAYFVKGALAAWDALPVLASEICRPFSIGRSGLTLGEGAAMVVLEEADHAARRGVPAIARLAGFGSSSDAGSITAPDVDGMVRAMRQAIADAGLHPDEVDHVNAHGTGTIANDVSEGAALLRVFGSRLDAVSVTASKSVLGHMMGTSGAVELIVAAKSIESQFIPPTANFLGRDPDCPVDCVPNQGRPARLRAVVSNSFAFGGLNAALVACHA